MRLGRLFGRKPFSALRSEADALYARGEFGLAKLAFERAMDSKQASTADRDMLDERVGDCCDAIAEQRLGEAERLRCSGEPALADDELRHALETARSSELKRKIADALESGERAKVREQVDALQPLDDEGKFLLLSGHWEAQQASEYELYGERFRQAIVRLHDGQVAVAAGELEALLTEVSDAQYLWFEVGRARHEHGDRLGAFEAMSTFLKIVDPNEGAAARLGAHLTLASIAAEHDDFERAMEHFGDAIETMPDDPRVYLSMGAFMRQHGLADEATDVLASGLAVVPDNEPSYQLWAELGMAHADAARPEPAIEWLEMVVAHFVNRNHLDLPPAPTMRLSQLHEQAGNLARAADLLRLLTEGSDGVNLFVYHLEAARLLTQLSASQEAESMLARAAELAPGDDEEAKAALDQAKATLRGTEP